VRNLSPILILLIAASCGDSTTKAWPSDLSADLDPVDVAVDVADPDPVDVDVAVDVAVADPDPDPKDLFDVVDSFEIIAADLSGPGDAVGCSGNAWVTCDPETGVKTVALCGVSDPCVTGACVPGEGCVTEPVQCTAWSACDGGACVETYPPPPYGAWAGDTVANHEFTDPTDLSTVALSEYWGEGSLLLLDFSAGWCIVCKNDTWVYNEWLGNCWDDGLRVVQVMYENPDQTPGTASYANGWSQIYDTQYPVLLDDATLGADGEAEGGVLASFLEPDGPGLVGYMPIPVLIDTATMEIVYIDTGMNKPLFHALITNHLGVNTCWD